MKILSTESPEPPSSDTARLHAYNGLDVMVTLEVFNAIAPQLDEVTSKVYDFERALQAPVLEMECRGVLVDLQKRNEVSRLLSAQLAQILESLQKICSEGLGLPPDFNPNSPKQLGELFYEVMGIPEIRKRGANGMSRTVGIAALEKLKDYFYAEPIVNHILALRDIKKKLSVLATGIDLDGRIRTSYNIAGTNTFRFSSYTSSFGSGTNLQNITGKLRSIFTADPGHKFVSIDESQVQSRIVGAIIWNYFKDGRYLDACESGDLHTLVCKLVWPHFAWSADAKANRKIADQPFYRVDSYRQASKKLGHATNFFGQPPQLSRQIHVPIDLIKDFQQNYLRAFPGVRERFDYTRHLLLKQGYITTMVGHRRWFFGRRWDDSTLRDALAYEPQAVESWITNQGMMNFFRNPSPMQLMLQGHDSLVIQYPEELEDELVPIAMKHMLIEVPLQHDRTLVVPVEAKVGWNWGEAYEEIDGKKVLVNPDGLIAYKGHDDRKRQNAPTASILDRRLLPAY